VADISILGAGNFGTTLALLLNDKGHKVKLWEFFPERAERLKKERENKEFLKGFTIPASVYITNELEEAVSGSELVILSLRCQVFRDVMKKLSGMVKDAILLSVSKGIELRSLKRMSKIMEEESKSSKTAVLSGPCIANEVARKVPTTVVVASEDEKVSKKIQDVFFTPSFRAYTNGDVIGVELGGALKNIIAIAAGICDGLQTGTNTKGALMTRGLAEITRMGVAMGAKPTTFAGLSGIGDLITTSFSKHSRNRFVGEEIGKGRKLKEILKGMIMVAEGVDTTKAALKLAKKYQVELPIAEQVYKILFKNKSSQDAISDLMMRKPKAEVWS